MLNPNRSVLTPAVKPADMSEEEWAGRQTDYITLTPNADGSGSGHFSSTLHDEHEHDGAAELHGPLRRAHGVNPGGLQRTTNVDGGRGLTGGFAMHDGGSDCAYGDPDHHHQAEGENQCLLNAIAMAKGVSGNPQDLESINWIIGQIGHGGEKSDFEKQVAAIQHEALSSAEPDMREQAHDPSLTGGVTTKKNVLVKKSGVEKDPKNKKTATSPPKKPSHAPPGTAAAMPAASVAGTNATMDVDDTG